MKNVSVFTKNEKGGGQEVSDICMELDDAGCDVGGYSQYEDEYCGCTVCAQCGYRFVRDDDVLRVRITGDIIHADCFIDYADDNVEALSSKVALSM